MNAGANRAQSTSATVTQRSRRRRARAAARRAPAPGPSAGGRGGAAARAAPSAARHAAAGPRAPGDRGGGQARGRGGARRARRGRRWRRRRRAWPPLPQTPAIEENSTNASRCVRSSSASRLPAPRDLGARRRRRRSAEVGVRRARSSWSAPAACTTARTAAQPRRAGQRPQRVAVGDVAGGDRRPARRARSARRAGSAAPGASGPRRLVSTRCSAPRRREPAGDVRAERAGAAGDQDGAARAPASPVPGRRRGGAHAGAGAKTPAARTATWSSSPPPASTAASSAAGAARPAVAGRSTRPPQRCGCSSAATRPRPQTWRLRRVGERVGAGRWRPRRGWRSHSGASTPASPSACTSASGGRRAPAVTRRELGRRGRLVERPAATGRRRHRRPVAEGGAPAPARRVGRRRHRQASTTVAPCASSARARRGRPARRLGRDDAARCRTADGLAPPVTGCQATRYRQPSTVDRSLAAAACASVDSAGSSALSELLAVDAPGCRRAPPGRRARRPPRSGVVDGADRVAVPLAVRAPASTARAGTRRWAGRPGAPPGEHAPPSRRRRRARAAAASGGHGGRGLVAVAAQHRHEHAVARRTSRRHGRTSTRVRARARGTSVTPGRGQRCARASANRTASRTCRTQYSGGQLVAVASVAGHRRTRPGSRRRVRQRLERPRGTRRASASISGEWNAWRHVQPPGPAASAPRGDRPAPSVLGAGDDHRARAVDRGDADARRSAAAATSASAACTATIAPPAGSACISRPRAATSVAASASDSTPATCAAASSPIEWPTRKSGVDAPRLARSRNSATSTANSAGCVYPVCVQQVRRRRRSTTSAHAGQSSVRAAPRRTPAANTGNAAYSSRPIPSRCEPWPVNRNASRRRGGDPAHDVAATLARGERGEAGGQVVPVAGGDDGARCSSGGAGGGQREARRRTGSHVGAASRGRAAGAACARSASAVRADDHPRQRRP